jgi:alanine racemase
MDYTLLDISKTDVSTGTEVEFWGLNILANTAAKTSGTISYELFTGVGDRVIRQAIE